VGETASDPFRTSAHRSAVLQAWAGSPARFREDANAEEALATGGYADRLLVELAANALDAARHAGRPGRVRFSLDTSGPVAQLRAANIGTPLTAAGVAGLASLRASAKRGSGASVGHFGVGFTAVLTVTDDPQVLSTTGGVVFSRDRTALALAALDVPELTEEFAARNGQVPVLRLPWPMDTAQQRRDPIPEGFDTQVRLPLRPGLLGELEAVLSAVGDDLLWALPGLMSVEIALPGRDLRVIDRLDLTDGLTIIRQDGAPTRYRAQVAGGTIPAALLADRPIEERSRDQWQLTWALPEPTDRVGTPLRLLEVEPGADPFYLGAPTPTDEPLSLPARLIGTFPVDDTRRRLAPGPLSAYLLDQAAAAYLDLFAAVAPEHRLSLVPSAGFPLGPVDAGLRTGIIRRLSRAPVLHTVLEDPVVPSSACVITGISENAARLLGRAVPGLLRPPRAPAELAALRLLGVGLLPLADATSALAGIDGEPSFWREVYEALSDQDAEDLANLPVPLTGGGRRIGPAGTLLPGADAVDVQVLRRAVALAPDLCVVHPGAAHPLLARLGAVPAAAAALLTDPALVRVFRDFRQDLEEDDPDLEELEELATLALDLVSAGGPAGGLLGDVVLTDSTGEAWPAGELLAPDAPLASVLSPDADLPLMGSRWAVYPERTLAVLGVRTGLKVVQVDNADVDLPDLAQWWSEVVGDGLPPETFDAVADLDLIDDDKWPQLLEMLAADRGAMRALASGPDPSYTRWWISRFAILAGESPHHWRTSRAVGLTGVYDELPIALDPAVAAAIGVLAAPVDAVRADPAELLMRLSDPRREVPAGVVPALTVLAVQALEADRALPLPASVRTLSGAVVDAGEAVVLDLPWFAQLIPPGRLVPGGTDPARVASTLELDLVSESTTVRVAPGATGPLSAAATAMAVRAALCLGVEPLAPVGERAPWTATTRVTLMLAPGLSVGIGDGPAQRVAWWTTTDGHLPAGPAGVPGHQVLLVDGSAAGIGRAVAFAAGRWGERGRAVTAALGEPVDLAESGLG
jgi:hypothetical protein